VISELQVNGLIILHRNKIPFFGQELYGGMYKDI
jgi:hypothetical protein